MVTRICFFTYERRLILQDRDKYFEYLPYNSRSRTRFQLHHIPFLATHVDITIKSDSIYVISRNSILAISSQPDPNAPKSIIDLYNQLPSSLQRIIGSVTWPEPACLDKIGDAIKAGAVIGASGGSVRRAEALSSQAWILHAADGSELTGKGPIDGIQYLRTSHRAEIQGQAALFLIIYLFIKFYGLVNCKVTTFCDNQSVVTKLKKGWQMLRLRHTKGADSDIQAILRETLTSLKATSGFDYSTNWVKAHQDDDIQPTALPRPVALNFRMDAETKAAYELSQRWLTQECVPVFPQERCAVYIQNDKITSRLHSSLLEQWHKKDALQYLQERHGIHHTLFRDIQWTSLRFALNKISAHRCATVVKALRRHLPTQAKLFQQGCLTMSSRCPRCLREDETHAHV